MPKSNPFQFFVAGCIASILTAQAQAYAQAQPIEHVFEFDFLAKKWTYKRSGQVEAMPRTFWAGSTIEYRVVNINPFIYRVQGKNDLTPFSAAELSKEQLALVSGNLGAAASQVTSENAPTAEGGGQKASAVTVQKTHQNGDQLANILNLEGSGLKSLVDLRVGQSVKLLEELDMSKLTVEQLNAELRRTHLVASSLASSSSFTFTEGTSKEILDRYRSILNELEVRRVKEFEEGFKPVNNDLTSTKGEATKLGTEVAKFSAGAALYAQLLRDRSLEPSAGESDSTRILQEIKERASHSVRSAGFDPAMPGEIVQTMTGWIGQIAALSKQIVDAGRSIENRAKSLSTSRSELLAAHEKAVEESLAFMERITSDEDAPMLITQLELIRIESMRKSIAARSKEVALANKVSGGGKGLADAAAEVGQNVASKTDSARKDISNASALYTLIKNTTSFTLVPSKATHAAEGTVNYVLNVYRIDGAAEVDVFGEDDPKFSYEVLDRQRPRLEFSALYLLNQTNERDYRLVQELDDNDVFTGNFIRDDLGSKGWSVTNLALMANYRFEPQATNSWGMSLGASPDLSRIYYGFSYMLGRKSGYSFFIGSSIGRIQVPKFGPEETFASDSEVFLKDEWRPGAITIGFGFRF